MSDSATGHEATEEDATELQFPKGAGSVRAGLRQCQQCGTELPEPHVVCVACPGNTALCPACFARGAEFPGHSDDHPYTIVGRCYPLGEGWGGREELALLAAIEECGLGNWGAVSARVVGRSAGECRDHYLGLYLHRPPPELADLLTRHHSVEGSALRGGVDPIEFIGGTDIPPRPLPGTLAASNLAGYCAPRGDFEVETDPTAETCVAGLEPELFGGAEDGCPGAALVGAVLDGYRRRMGERHRAKRVVRELGLLGAATTTTTTAITRLRHLLPRHLREALPRLVALLRPMELDLLVAGLQAEEELHHHIRQLAEYRLAGLTKKAGVATYEALRRRREAGRRERQCLVVCGKGQEEGWVTLGRGSLTSQGVPGTHRRTQPPLNIVGLPGYTTLTEEEKKVSSELRIIPELFLHHKRLLVAESNRAGGIKLGQARTLLKIDVNKTRRIFDVLKEAGDITDVLVQPGMCFGGKVGAKAATVACVKASSACVGGEGDANKETPPP